MLRPTRAALAGAAVFVCALTMADTAMAGSRFFLFDPSQNAYRVFDSSQNAYRSSQPQRSRQARNVRLPAIYQRQVVAYAGDQAPGTIIVSTGDKFLYYVLGNGQAMRYGIGTARTGFEWSGTHHVSQKREWPGWTPPSEMRKRQPYLPAHMEGGIGNPLGARAIYIGSTLYRIHGTNEPWTIGQNVSSGCIRMVNDDVEDLYSRVKIGAKVIVL